MNGNRHRDVIGGNADQRVPGGHGCDKAVLRDGRDAFITAGPAQTGRGGIDGRKLKHTVVRIKVRGQQVRESGEHRQIAVVGNGGRAVAVRGQERDPEPGSLFGDPGDRRFRDGTGRADDGQGLRIVFHIQEGGVGYLSQRVR